VHEKTEKDEEEEEKNQFLFKRIISLYDYYHYFYYFSIPPSRLSNKMKNLVFVSSKSYIYITPNCDSKITSSNVNRTDASEQQRDLSHGEPIYENIEKDEDGNGVEPITDNNNKFTIYVNYDFIKGEKQKNSCNKSSVRLLEPDVQLVHINYENDDYKSTLYAINAERRHNSNDISNNSLNSVSNNNNNDVNDSVSGCDDNDEENNSKSMSKMIQCQQISMYIGEKN
jgi:hypothetical protein